MGCNDLMVGHKLCVLDKLLPVIAAGMTILKQIVALPLPFPAIAKF